MAAASVVHDGYLLQKTVARSPIGGRLLSHCMLQSVQSKGITIQPSYSFKRVERTPGQFEVRKASCCSGSCFWQSCPSYEDVASRDLAVKSHGVINKAYA